MNAAIALVAALSAVYYFRWWWRTGNRRLDNAVACALTDRSLGTPPADESPTGAGSPSAASADIGTGASGPGGSPDDRFLYTGAPKPTNTGLAGDISEWRFDFDSRLVVWTAPGGLVMVQNIEPGELTPAQARAFAASVIAAADVCASPESKEQL